MKKYCSNCHKKCHTSKYCSEPSTSIGICCFKMNSKLTNSFRNKINNTNYYDIDNNTNIVISNISKFNKYNTLVHFLLVRRKYSVNYIDFIRGKYETSELLHMFNYMSIEEVNNIKTSEFNELWNNLWTRTSKHKIYMNEFIESETKFNNIRTSGLLFDIIQMAKPYETTEWEIPKGRKNMNETNIECAIREFKEETSLSTNTINEDYTVLNCIDPIHDTFTGTNNKLYKHIFYVGMANDITIPYHKNDEIAEVKWCTWDETIKLIRPYNENKIKIITNIFLFIININEANNVNYLKATL
jgi:8-oxo-dGTP pyrophosphatase MutT (NUDIX family)